MDVLVVQNRLWVVILESKRMTISVLNALPQTLTYLMTNPQSPAFGMVTNGDETFFVKLSQQGIPEYDVSDIFSPFPARNRVHTIVKILKRIGNVIATET